LGLRGIGTYLIGAESNHHLINRLSAHFKPWQEADAGWA